MLQNSSNPQEPDVPETVTTAPVSVEPNNAKRPSMGKRIAMAFGLPAWVFVGFIASQLLVLAAVAGAQASGVSFDTVNTIVFNAVVGAIVYALAIFIVLGLPALIKRKRKPTTTSEELGLKKKLSWVDIAIVPLAFIGYIILSAVLLQFAEQWLSFVDFDQEQEIGFSGLTHQYEYILAFLSLVIIAPVAEEVLFRGYLFGKLGKYTAAWVSILITSLLFAIVHFQWNVGIDVFALSIVLCLLRIWRGSIWAPIMLHMLKNGIAFYFLFINPGLLSTLGG